MAFDRRGLSRVKKRPDLTLSSLLFLAALAVRSVYFLRVHPPYLLSDIDRYIHIAWAIGAGDFGEAVHYHYHPLLPLLILAVHGLGWSYESASNIVSIVMSSLVVFPVYFLGSDLFGRRAAALGGAFYAFRFYHGFVEAQPEQVLFFLTYLAVFSGRRALISRRAGAFLLTGALLGLGFLAKPEASAFFLLFFLIAAVALWLRQVPAEGGRRTLRYARLLAVVVGGYIIFAGPWLVSYYRDTGRISLNPKADTLFAIHNFLYANLDLYRIRSDASGPYTPAQRIYMEGDKKPTMPRAAVLLWRYRDQMAHIYTVRLKLSLTQVLPHEYLSRIVPWAWPLLLLIGLVPRRRNLAHELYLHSFMLAQLLAVPLFSHQHPRFFMGLMPWMMIVFGRGANRVVGFFKWSARDEEEQAPAWIERAAAGVAVLVLAASAATGIAMKKPDEAYWREIAFEREMAQKIHGLLPPGCRFMAELHSPGLWYLAGFKPDRQVVLPLATPEQAAQYATATGARLLVVHPSVVPGRYLGYAPLFSPDYSSPLFLPLYRGKSPDGKDWTIYEAPDVKCGKLPEHKQKSAGP